MVLHYSLRHPVILPLSKLYALLYHKQVKNLSYSRVDRFEKIRRCQQVVNCIIFRKMQLSHYVFSFIKSKFAYVVNARMMVQKCRQNVCFIELRT